MLIPYQPPPFWSDPTNAIGSGIKKPKTKMVTGLLQGKSSPLKGIPIFGDIF